MSSGVFSYFSALFSMFGALSKIDFVIFLHVFYVK